MANALCIVLPSKADERPLVSCYCMESYKTVSGTDLHAGSLWGTSVGAIRPTYRIVWLVSAMRDRYKSVFYAAVQPLRSYPNVRFPYRAGSGLALMDGRLARLSSAVAEKPRDTVSVISDYFTFHNEANNESRRS